MKEFSNNNSSLVSILIGVIFGVVGLGLMFIHVIIGFFFVLLGVVLFFSLRYFANDTRVSCHDNGFTVTVINKRKGTSVQEHAWADVTETLYYEKESGGENNSTTCYFQVQTAKGTAFNLHAMKNFDELIDIFNQKTVHIPYVWVKPKGMFKSHQKQNRISS
ncbi:hypothetical protein RCG23_05825 [Neobacillus sp. PS3-34]|uniref:hypothetical protein n=1 Tax=Neobacillus sp. PS3-34 TaxID=3070678 RepID=UPI0027E1B887|nr:hypothetical protein [Neobacillus sp. PS3-34]WML49508.1 hypothetical protein RCG23_05825 [Neobacillus sp. PS3-34]